MSLNTFRRPTPDEWLSAWPHLRQSSGELVGPCPVCGGLEKPDADRFSVQQEPPYLFHCRKCPNERALPKLAAKLAGAGPFPNRPSTFRPIYRPRRAIARPQVAAAESFTLRDLARSPIWIAVRNKRPVTWRRRGELIGWRYSRPEGVAIARFGGTVTVRQRDRDIPLHILPWSTARGVERTLVQHGQGGAKRQLCLTGDSETPFDLDIACIDFDVHAADNPAAAVLTWRDNVAARLADARCPVTTSSGGVGFHALVRVNPAEWPRKVLVDVDDAAGLAIEILPPGAKVAVALDLGSMANESGWDAEIPYFSRGDLVDVVTGIK